MLWVVGACACYSHYPAVPHSHVFGATRVPVMNPAWAVPTVVIDGQNSTGLASKDGSGLDATHPVSRWDEVNDARWGCYGSPSACPRTTGDMWIRFMSSQQVGDTFRFQPSLETSSNIKITCDLPAPSATGTLAGVTLTTRANNAPPLVATLVPATGALAVGQFVVTANAVFQVAKSDGANVWELSQPYAPAVLTGLHSPTAKVAVANGDAYSAYVLNTINAESLFPTGYQTGNNIVIDRCKLGADATTTLNVGLNVDLEECDITSVTLAHDSIYSNVPWAFNDEVRNGFLELGDDDQFLATGYEFIGGQLFSGAYLSGHLQIDGDYSSNGSINETYGVLGEIYLGSSAALSIYGVVVAMAGYAHYGDAVIYGVSHLDVRGGGHLYYDVGAGLAAHTFPLTGGVNLYYSSNHLAVDTSVDPAVWHARSTNGHQLVLDLDKSIANGGYGMGAAVGCAFGQGDSICTATP